MKEQTIKICNKFDGSQGKCVVNKKPIPKVYTVYDFTYIALLT